MEDELEDMLKSNSSFCLVFDLGSDKGKTLCNYLKDHHITAIDALYISHFHYDHYQPEAIQRLAESDIAIRKIVLPHGALTPEYLHNQEKSEYDDDLEYHSNRTMIESLLSYGKINIDGIYGLLKEDLTGQNSEGVPFNGSILGKDYYGLLVKDITFTSLPNNFADTPSIDVDEFDEFFKALKEQIPKLKVKTAP